MTVEKKAAAGAPREIAQFGYVKSLTRKGAAVYRKVHDAVVAERRRLFAGLAGRDLDELKHILATLEKNAAGRLATD